MGRKKLLVLASTYPRWAGDHEPGFVHELSKRLTIDFDIHVLCPHAPGALQHEILDEVYIHRFRYAPAALETLVPNGGILNNLKHHPWKWLLIPFFLISLLLSTLALVRRIKPDLLHAHWIIPQGVAIAITGMFIKLPRILLTSHGGDLFTMNSTLFKHIKTHVASKADAITVVSSAMIKPALRLGAKPEQLHVIPMGVDLKESFIPHYQVRNPYQLLFVGRMVEKKGIEYLIKAMSHVVQDFPQVKLSVVGDGPYLTIAKTLSLSLKLDNHIEFLGAVENQQLPELYQAAAIFVAPFIEAKNGDQEGLGLVLVEAMGCGCAVITSDMPAVHDVVIANETGMLVPQRDARALALGVARLLNSPATCNRISRKGREFVSTKFDWDIVSARYSALLKESIQAGSFNCYPP